MKWGGGGGVVGGVVIVFEVFKWDRNITWKMESVSCPIHKISRKERTLFIIINRNLSDTTMSNSV